MSNSSEVPNDAVSGLETRELVRLPVVRMRDVVLSRLVVRDEAARMGFPARALTQIATAVSEVTRNVVQHAHAPGQLRLFEVTERDRSGLKIAVDDAGGGIADVDLAMAGLAPGAGIPGCRTLMDEFAIRSSAGQGTAVSMIKWSARASDVQPGV
jgi:serine/threonine-protein kinase RsbT